MTQLPFLNLGCGRIILPAPKPQHYGLLDDIFSYALWHNVDRNPEPGVDETLDIFRYPWPWADNSFDGALCAHIAEHIPHEIRISERKGARRQSKYSLDAIDRMQSARTDTEKKAALKDAYMFAVADQREPDTDPRAAELADLQDGWYAFFAELHRVLTPGAIIHVLSPYAWSDGAMHDPSHTRYLTPATFQHSMVPNPDAPFAYATGGLHLEMVEPARYNIAEAFQHLIPQRELLQRAVDTQINVVSEFSVKLRVVK